MVGHQFMPRSVRPLDLPYFPADLIDSIELSMPELVELAVNDPDKDVHDYGVKALISLVQKGVLNLPILFRTNPDFSQRNFKNSLHKHYQPALSQRLRPLMGNIVRVVLILCWCLFETVCSTYRNYSERQNCPSRWDNSINVSRAGWCVEFTDTFGTEFLSFPR